MFAMVLIQIHGPSCLWNGAELSQSGADRVVPRQLGLGRGVLGRVVLGRVVGSSAHQTFTAELKNNHGGNRGSSGI